MTLKLRGKVYRLTEPWVMGILNVTPDSFYAGSRLQEEEALVGRAVQMVEEGAKILDVGGYSTRPGADEVTIEEEISRVTGAIMAIRKVLPEVVISIDTFRARVAEAAVNVGGDLVNDVSGGTLDADMFKTVARCGVPYILMHMLGTPQNMKSMAKYDDLVPDIIEHLSQRLRLLRDIGVTDVIIDPGFGFAKTPDHNFELLRYLDSLRVLDCHVLAGVSRKSMIYKTLEVTPEDALNGTTALNMTALLNYANILRVHDVKAAVETITLFLKTLD